MKHNDVAMVIAAGGSGSRFSSAENKLFSNLDGLPVFIHCIKTFSQSLPQENLILVVSESEKSRFESELKSAGFTKVKIVLGGDSRQDSVYNGLKAAPENCTIVGVHDAARPYVTTGLLNECIKYARIHGSGVAAHKVVNTIKLADASGKVIQTPDRNLCWAAETPQIFNKENLLKAYEFVIKSNVTTTDDAQVLELFSLPVYLVENSCDNLKITYKKDLN